MRAPTLRADARTTRNLILEDTTLRDGEQAPGIAFSADMKLEIHDALVDAGVRWIEAGIPAMGGDELRFLERLLARGSDAMLIAWNRGVRADVEQSLDLGFKGVHIGLPASPIHLETSVRRGSGWLLDTAADLVKLAKDRGAFVSISAEDVGRADLEFLQEYACHVHAAGADRLRLSDTIGILGPSGYAERVRAIAAVCPIDTQCHTHNDFGLAVANTLAGIEAGARYFHVTVNAVGERAGMPDIAQTVLALQRLHGIDVGIATERLHALSRTVARACGQPVVPWQPVVGDNVFAHESGIHVNAMLRDTSSFEPFPPELVGGKRRYVLGKYSGRALIRAVLAEHGVECTDDEVAVCLERVRAEAVARAGALEPHELVRIASELRAEAVAGAPSGV